MSGTIGRVTTAQVRREMMRTERRASRRRFAIGAIVVAALAIAAGVVAARFVFTLADIRTLGMSPALQSGDVALFERMDSPIRPLQLTRGALALVRYSDSGMQCQAVRRVIAMGGDEVSVEDDGRVSVNGQPLEEAYAAYRSKSDWSGDQSFVGGALENPFASPDATPAPSNANEAPDTRVDDMEYPLTVPEGKLFVLCDDREDAMDSRSSRFGLVNEEDVLGLARAIIWPVHRAGLLTNGGIQ